MQARTWISLFVALAVGFTGGVWFAQDSASERDALVSARSESPPDEGAVSDVELADDGRAIGQAGSRAQVTGSDAGDSVPAGAVERAVASFETPFAAATGSGSVTGSVTDTAGRPIEGVRVFVRPVAARPTPSTPEERMEEQSRALQLPGRGIEEVLAETAASWSRARGSTLLGSTDGNGRYEVGGLEEGERYFVTLDETNHRFQLVDGDWSMLPGDANHWVGRAIVETTFDVRLPDGEQAARARVEGSGGFGRLAFDWTPRTPTCRVVEGVWRVRAFVGSGEASGPFRTVSEDGVAIDSETGVVVLELRERPSVRVHLESPAPLPGRIAGQITLLIEEDGEFVVPRWDPRDRSASEALEAYFHGPDPILLQDAPPGRYVARVEVRQLATAFDSVPFEIVDRCVDVSVPLPAIRVTPALTLWVTNLRGEAVPAQGGSRTIERENGMSSSTFTFLPGPDGSRIVPGNGLEIDGVEHDAPPFRLTVRHPGYLPGSVMVERGQTEVAVVLGDPASVHAHASGLPERARNPRITLTPVDPQSGGWGSEPRTYRESLDGDGRCALEGVVPGLYDVELRAVDDLLARERVQIVVGANTVELFSEPRHRVVVDAASLDVGTRMVLRAVEVHSLVGDDVEFEADVYSNSNAYFDGVPPGTYSLSAHGVDRTVEIVVPTSSAVF